MKLPLIQHAKIKNKLVLIRVDHNVVKKGKIKDPYRIDASLPTIEFILKNGGKPIIMSHVGRPKDKKTGEIILNSNTSVKPIVEYLNQKMNKNFATPQMELPSTESLIKPDYSHLISKLKNNEIDGIYLPNTRWFRDEEVKNEDRIALGKYLSSLADIFVNDAFGSWQPHASTIEPTKHLPSYAGFLMQREIENLSNVLTPKRPLIAVVAGSKFDTKIGPLTALLERADYLVLGGVLYNAYLCAKYGCSINGIDDDDIKSAKKFLKAVEKVPEKLIELPEIIESDLLDEKNINRIRVQNVDNLNEKTKLSYILDASASSFQTEKIKKIFQLGKTIFVNAVMGLIPNFSEGTVALNHIIDNNKNALKLFGGGDTLQEFKNLLPDIYNEALEDDKYYFFTGGGTILKAIQEGSAYELGPIKALLECKIQ